MTTEIAADQLRRHEAGPGASHGDGSGMVG